MKQLFLDDDRFPPEKGEWHIVRTYNEAVDYCKLHGCPKYISFDHDIGPRPDGDDFAKWLIETDMDNFGTFIPPDFSFYVHSQNCVGAKSIQNRLDFYLKQRQWIKY